MTQTTEVDGDLLEYFSSWLNYRRWYLRIPGVQAAVRQDGELVLSVAFGRSNLGTGEELTTRHLFRVASHSKTFTAVLLLQLVEQGAVRLDDPIGSYLPALGKAAIRDRTIGELLAHSGGVIRDSLDGDFWQLHRPFPDRDELIVIARDGADVLASNEHFKYSNIGYGLLGLAIEAVSGESFADQLAAAVIEPLGLHDTGAELDARRADQYAAGHSSLAIARTRQVLEHVNTEALAAATGCYSTATDLTAFYSALLPGDTRLLRPESLLRQRHKQWDVKGDERGYGLGLFFDRIADTDLFGHTGGYPGHITCTHADPHTGTVLSVLTNALDGAASAMAAGYFHLRSLARNATHTPGNTDTRRFLGRFAGTLGGLCDVARLGDHLFAINPEAPNPAEDAVPLEVLDATTLKIAGGTGGNSYGETMRYQFAADGTVQHVRGNSSMTLTPFRTPHDEADPE